MRPPGVYCIDECWYDPQSWTKVCFRRRRRRAAAIRRRSRPTRPASTTSAAASATVVAAAAAIAAAVAAAADVPAPPSPPPDCRYTTCTVPLRASGHVMVVEYDSFYDARFTALRELRRHDCLWVADPSEPYSPASPSSAGGEAARRPTTWRSTTSTHEWAIAGEGPRSTRRRGGPSTARLSRRRLAAASLSSISISSINRRASESLAAAATTVRFFAAASAAPEVMPELDAADAVTVELIGDG